MTLRIRELVIRAEIGSDTASDAAPGQGWQPSESASLSKPDSMTLRFYKEESNQENER